MVTDLTGTTGYINYAPTLSSGYYEINFTSRGSSFTSIDILPSSGGTDSSSGEICYYNDGETYTQIYAYDSVSWPQCGGSVQYYRGITFTGGSGVTNQSLITGLENNAVQVTIDTLSNTSGLINEVPESYAGYELYPDSSIGANINFIIASNPSVTYSNLTGGSKTSLRYRIGPAADLNYLTVYSSGGVNDAYRAITIIDGSDVNSNFLRGGFQANATPYVKPIEYIDKVVLTSGDEYYLKDSISGYIAESDLVAGNNIQISATSEGVSISKVSGGQAKFRFIRYPKPVLTDLTNTVWYFNEHPQRINPNTYNITFTSNNTQYLRIGNHWQGSYLYDLNYYTSLSGSGMNYAYESTSDASEVGLGSWSNQEYRTIVITGGTDATNSELIAWLEASATRVS